MLNLLAAFSGCRLLDINNSLALREGLFALELIEKEMFATTAYVRLSNFKEVLKNTMLDQPENWNKHYHGSRSKVELSLKYSYSDRERYYLPDKNVEDAINILLENLKTHGIPPTLISQYMPMQYTKIKEKKILPTPEFLLKDKIENLIDDYIFAMGDFIQ